MNVGDLVELPGYSYRITLHGPMIMSRCVDCGKEALIVQRTGRINTHGLEEDVPTSSPRCGSCGRAHHGLGPM